MPRFLDSGCRHVLVAVVAAVIVTGCTWSGAGSPTGVGADAGSTIALPTTPTTDPPPTSTETRETSESTDTTEDKVEPYKLVSNEVERELKRAAVRFVETLLTYEPSPDPFGDAAQRLESAGFDPLLVAGAVPLLTREASSEAAVVYPQLGGLEPKAASVMVVVDHHVTPDDCCPTVTTRTLDVRLDRDGIVWMVVDLTSAGGIPPIDDVSVDSDLAQQVLGNPAIRLPDSGRWDIESGIITDELLKLLLAIADAGHTIDVTTLASGHPVNVFGRPYLSNHTRGRAVDIWAVDGEPVAGSSPESGAYQVVELALAFGATEVGAPWNVDGPAGSAFTNALHADHLHLAFDFGG